MSTNPTNLAIVPPQTVWQSTHNRKREALWIAEGSKCHWCGIPTRLCAEPVADQCTIEHIIPQAQGGTNAPENLCSACRLCNSRRGYEQTMGLPDGSLLGTYPVTNAQKKAFGFHSYNHSQGKFYQHIALTKDDKNKIMGKHSTEDVLREQRDQAQKEIAHLRKEMKIWEGVIKAQEGELKLFHKIVEDQEKEFKSLTVWVFIRKKLAEWIKP